MNRFRPNQNGQSGGRGAGFLFVWALFWWCIVGLFDVMIARQITRQVESTWFAAAPARILQSEVTARRGSKGTTYGVKFQYTYSVNGTTYTGTRYTFDGMSSSDSQWARDAVAAFPAGAERNCFYDPRNPATAVLAPGLHGSDIAQMMFLTPFNLIGAFVLSLAIRTRRDPRTLKRMAPRFADRVHGREAYALNQYSPLMTFFGVFLVASFLGTFALVFTGGFHPTMTTALTVWGTGFAIAGGAAVYVHLQRDAGRYDLVFDENSRTITVPPGRKRQTVERIPMADVKRFDVERVESGYGKSRKVTWRVKMLAGEREVLLQESFLEPQAKRLAETLNAKLNG